MKLKEVIENVLTDYYSSHSQGEQLFIYDLQNIVNGNYLVPEGKSKLEDLEELEEENERLEEENERLEEEIEELLEIISKCKDLNEG